MSRAGLEPTTLGLKGRYSTIELAAPLNTYIIAYLLEVVKAAKLGYNKPETYSCVGRW